MNTAEIPFEDFEFKAETPQYNVCIKYKKINIKERSFTVNGEIFESIYNDKIKANKIFIPYEEIKANKNLIVEIEE